eukprot:804360-Pyramimonas_sp.AAC.2
MLQARVAEGCPRQRYTPPAEILDSRLTGCADPHGNRRYSPLDADTILECESARRFRNKVGPRTI